MNLYGNPAHDGYDAWLQQVIGDYYKASPPPIEAPVVTPGQGVAMDIHSRVNNGFQDGSGGVDPAEAAALQQAAQQRVPSGAQPYRDPSVAPGPRMMHQAQPAGGPGWVDDVMSGAQQNNKGLLSRFLPEGVGDVLGSAAYGLANSDPTATPLSAFGQAFAGAQAARQSRLDRKRAEQTAERDYQMKMEDRAYERSEDEEDDLIRDEESDRDKRRFEFETSKAQLEEISAIAGIKYKQAQTRKILNQYNGIRDLTFNQRSALMQRAENYVNDKIKREFGGYGGSIDLPKDEKTGEILPEAQAKIEAWRREGIEKYFPGVQMDEEGTILGEGEDSGGTSTVTRGGAGDFMPVSGSGTEEEPLVFSTPEIPKEVLEQIYATTGQPVYFVDENGDTLEYPPD